MDRVLLFRSRLRLIAVFHAFLVLLCGATPASADVGLPMLAAIWPQAMLLFIPVVVVEAVVGSRIWRLRARRVVFGVLLANMISTLVGLPITWFGYLFFITLPARPTIPGRTLTLRDILVNSAWISPAANEATWIVPASALVLSVPFFFASVLIEGFVVRCFKDIRCTSASWRWAWIANGISYGLIALGLIVLVWAGLRR